MALIECTECGNQISENASSCPACGFDISTHYEQAAESNAAIFMIAPIILYFAVLLGGIYLGQFDTNHKFFHVKLLDISVLNWLYIPIFAILGGVPVFKHAWWGGWNGAIFICIAIIFAVRFVAPELSPF